MKFLRRTTSAAAGIGLGTTIKYLRRSTSGAAGDGLSATIKYLRRATSGAAGRSLGTTNKYLRRKTSCAARSSLLAPPPPVSKWICVIVVAIGHFQHRKHRVSSAWSVDITLSSILFIL
jgi:hypothetical protein